MIDAAWALVTVDAAREDYEEMYCLATRALSDALTEYDAEVLRGIEGRDEVPRRAFNRSVYQREYMRGYMRRRRSALRLRDG